MSIDLEELGNRIKNGEAIGRDSKFSKEDINSLYSLGYGLYNSGDLAEAETIFRRLILAEPLIQRNWIGFAATLQMEDQFHEALSGWSMACLLNDEDPLPHFHAAECYLSLKNTSEALAALTACEERLKDQHKHLRIKIDALREIWGA